MAPVQRYSRVGSPKKAHGHTRRQQPLLEHECGESNTQARLGYTRTVGSLKLGGIRFAVYSNDHAPRHVHGYLGETVAIVDLMRDGAVGLARRWDAIRPFNAKRSDVRKVLHTAALNFEALVALWEAIHGKA